MQNVYSRLYSKMPLPVSTKAGKFIIRKLEASDSPRYYAMTSDPELAKWMCGHPIKDLITAKKIVDATVEGYDSYYGSRFGICGCDSTEQIIGVCSVKAAAEQSPSSRIVEIGYYLDKAYKGKGIGTQVVHKFVGAIADCAGNKPTYCIARVREDNIASRKILERCGFTKVIDEGSDKPKGVPIVRYGIRLV